MIPERPTTGYDTNTSQVCMCLKFVLYDFMKYPIHDAVCLCLKFVLYDFIITTVITFIEIANLIGQERSSDRIDLYFIFQ